MKLFGPYKKRSRSASMQLSINAIVILVMAMAVLGIGLGLIRGVLGKGKEKLTNAVEAMDLSEPATAEKPLTNINNLKIRRNTEETLAIGFYNTDHTACGINGSILNISCTRHNHPLNWTFFDTLPFKVGQGESKKLGATVKTLASTGKYLCNIEVYCGKSNGVPIVVESASAALEVTS